MDNYNDKQEKSLVLLKIKKEVSRKITFFNFFLTLSIVLYHICGWYNELPMHKTWGMRIFTILNSVSGIMGGIALRSFFLISGFLLFNGCENTDDMKRKVKKRLKTLGIPFLIWNILTLILYWFRRPGVPVHNLKELLIGFSLVPFDGPLWYIFVIIILLFPSLLVIKLKNNKIASTIFLITISVFAFEISACNIFPILTGNEYGFWIERTVRNLPLFFLGAYGAMHFSDVILLERYNNKIIIPVFAILFVLSVFLSNKIVNGKIRWVIVTISPILLWFGFYSKVFIKDLGWLFKCNFFIYALHGPFLLDIIVEKTTSFDIGDRVFYPIEIVLFKIIILIFIYFTSVGIAFLLKKIMKDKYYNLLSGGRVN